MTEAPTLTCMRGYSGAGKSYRAAELAKKTGAVIVNRDLIRLMLLGEWWTGVKTDEDRVTVAEEAQVKALLKSSTSVVIDNTHLHPPFLRRWARLASRMGAAFEVVDVHVDPEECKRRVYQRWATASEEGRRYLDPKVIDQQVQRWPVEKWPTIKADPPFVVEPVEVDYDLPDAIIVDIDGTLAHIPEGGRSPYDYSRVSEDVIDPIVRDITWMWQDDPNKCKDRYVLICSGRDDDCRDATRKWLKDNDVFYDELFMRPTKAVDIHGGKLPDYLVKYNLFNEHIRGKYDVQFVLDDRLQVCQLWHRLGLKILRVGDPDADF